MKKLRKQGLEKVSALLGKYGHFAVRSPDSNSGRKTPRSTQSSLLSISRSAPSIPPFLPSSHPPSSSSSSLILSKLCWYFRPPSVCYLCLHQSSSPSYTLFKLRCDFFFFFFFFFWGFFLASFIFFFAHQFQARLRSFVLLLFCLLSLIFCLFVCLIAGEFLFFCGLKLPISSDFFFRCCILVVVLLRVLRLMKSTAFFFDRIFLPCNFSTASESVFIALSLDDSSRFFPSPNVAAPVQERSASCAAR